MRNSGRYMINRIIVADILSLFSSGALKYLKQLTHLTFGRDFNQNIVALKYLKQLIHLTFCRNFNQNIDALEDSKQ